MAIKKKTTKKITVINVGDTVICKSGNTNQKAIVIKTDKSSCPYLIKFIENRALRTIGETEWCWREEITLLKRGNGLLTLLNMGEGIPVSNSYSAMLENGFITVGCQTIREDAILALAKYIQQKNRKKDAKRNNRNSKVTRRK